MGRRGIERALFGATVALLCRCSIYNAGLLPGNGGSGGYAGAAPPVAGQGAQAGGGTPSNGGSGGTSPVSEAGASDGGAACDDALMNGDETAVDCGGSCPACPAIPCNQLVPGPSPDTVVGGDALVGWYRFEDARSMGADSSRAANNAGSSRVTQGSDETHGCVAIFNGGAGLELAVSVRESMTLAVWMRTDVPGQGSFDKQWYDGSSVIDADSSGTVNDFGLALLAGQPAFGVGNPDTTLHATRPIDDGIWHHVAATRNNTTGEVKLFLDGVQNANQLLPKGQRSAGDIIGIGTRRLVAELSDARIYERVLSVAEIADVFAGK